ncbi:hypothetical protein HN385_00345 [archaeon]|jgi:hypothetical protein|nr:hypothetical protein [archaeon]MBT3451627.1 hypothetical protein [archaeon]MBT6869648.1 hypothetical protein [archaeon]MBT7192416.1 hypothetical protein [archaeon]MBT7380217.1 hypothetical protein [archaeon]
MEGSIRGNLSNNNLESLIGEKNTPKHTEISNKKQNPADLMKVKDLIKDLYSGLNVKELKRRYSSFDLNFDKNWSWENRIKNVESILNQYITIDNYIGSIGDYNSSIENQDKKDQSERFLQTNNYLSLLQDIEELTNKTLTKLDKRYRKVKNHNNIVKPRLSKISDHINNNFDEISNYESELSNKEIGLNLFTPGKPIFIDEQVPLPTILRAEDHEYKISESIKSLQSDIEIVEIDFENNNNNNNNNNNDDDDKNQPKTKPDRITEYIQREKARAKINVKNWFSEMTKVKNPTQYLKSQLESISYKSIHEQEIIQTYSEQLNERINSPVWRKIFGEKKSTGFFQRVSNYFQNKKINSIENIIQDYTSKWNSQAEIIKKRDYVTSNTNEHNNNNNDNNHEEQDEFLNALTKIVQGDNGKGKNINRVDPFFEPFRSQRHKPKLANATVATVIVGGSLMVLGFGAAYANHANKNNQETLDWINNGSSHQELNLSYLDKSGFVAPQLRVFKTKEIPVEPEGKNYVPLTIDNVNRMQTEIPTEVNQRFEEISDNYQFNPTLINYFPGDINLNENSVNLQEDQEKIVMLTYGTPNPKLLRGPVPKKLTGFNSLTEQSQYFINEIYHSRGELPKGELFITGNGFDAEVSQVINDSILHTTYKNGRPLLNV